MKVRVARLAGAIIAEADKNYLMVGHTKEPCDYAAEGFDTPDEWDPLSDQSTPLHARSAPRLEAPVMTMTVPVDNVGQLLWKRFAIFRNGSISERLWTLVLENSPNTDQGEIDIQWLADTPDAIWEIVRDGVLRCT